MSTLHEELFGGSSRARAVNSKAKGNANELALAKLLTKWTGQEFVRVPQSGGLRWGSTSNICGDLICTTEEFPCIVETKHLKDIHLIGKLPSTSKVARIWREQLMADVDRDGNRRTPMLILRRNGMPKNGYIIYLPTHIINTLSLPKVAEYFDVFAGVRSEDLFSSVTYSQFKYAISMQLGNEGIELIQEWEGLKLSPYLCSAKVPTIGIGSTTYEDGTKVTMKDKPITEQRAYELFRNTVKKYEEAVAKYVKSAINQNQFDALVAFCYNVGIGDPKVPIGKGGGFIHSTLLRKVNANPNDESIRTEFLRWNKAGGVVVKGLTNRRTAELNLYFKK